MVALTEKLLFYTKRFFFGYKKLFNFLSSI